MLDGGPSRVPKSTDRRAVYRTGSVRRQPEEPQYAEMEQPRDTYRESAPRRKSSKRWLKIAAAIVVLIAIGVLGWFTWSNMRGADVTIDSSKHQAVFFASGQVYFGELEMLNDDYMKLTGVFYIQSDTPGESADNEDPQAAAEGNMQLIKLGEEVHSPEDAMIINRDQVLFFENLKSDGRVSQLIEDYEPSN